MANNETQQIADDILRSEITVANRKVKTLQSSDLDNVTLEMMLATEEFNTGPLYKNYRSTSQSCILPNHWTMSMFGSLHKKGFKSVYDNSSTVTLEKFNPYLLPESSERQSDIAVGAVLGSKEYQT